MSDEKNETTRPSGAPAAEAQFHFIKTENYSEIPVHGAWGGINLHTGNMYMAVYAERSAIPQEQVFRQSEDGVPQEVKDKRKGKAGSVRIVQSVLHFDVATAVSIRNWLNARIKAFTDANPETKSVLDSIRDADTPPSEDKK